MSACVLVVILLYRRITAIGKLAELLEIPVATNTNWQVYVPETSVSYLTQMLGLARENFVSAAIGSIVMAAVLIPVLAILIYPAWGMQGPAAWTAALTISTPFNLFKGFVSSTISLAFYRRLQPFLVGRPVQKAA